MAIIHAENDNNKTKLIHLDSCFIWNRNHRLRRVLLGGDGAGFSGEGRDTSQVHSLCTTV